MSENCDQGGDMPRVDFNFPEFRALNHRIATLEQQLSQAREALEEAWDLVNGHDGCPNWDTNDVEPYDRLRAFVKERLHREGR